MSLFSLREFTLTKGVPHGSTVTVGYPSGLSQADFTGDRASAEGLVVINGNDGYPEAEGKIDIQYGDGQVVVTNLSGVAWLAGDRARVQLVALTVASAAVSEPVVVPSLLGQMQDALAEGGDELVQAADALCEIATSASAAKKLGVLASYEALPAEEKAEHIGAMLETVNAGESIVLDEDRRATGYWYGPVEPTDIVAGTPGNLPPDAESLRAVRDYVDISADIVEGTPNTLLVDLVATVNSRVAYDDDLTIMFAAIVAEAIGQGYVGTVEIENDGVSPVTLTFDLAGTGQADVVLHDALGGTLEVAAGDVVALYAAVALDGSVRLSASEPA